MMNRFRLTAIAIVCAAISLFAMASIARAGNPVNTILTIDPIGTVLAGQPFTVTGAIKRNVAEGTEGIASRQVQLYIEPLSANNIISKTFLVGSVQSNQEGRLKWQVNNFLPGGKYRLYFIYTGSTRLTDASAITDLDVSDALPVNTEVRWRPFLPSLMSIAIPTKSVDVGETITIAAKLTNKLKAPISNVKVYLDLSGAKQMRTTNKNGAVAFVINKPLTPGKNTGRVWYAGINAYMPVEQNFVIEVNSPVQTAIAFTRNDKPLYIGDKLDFTARLTADGQPIANQFVRFYLNGEFRYGVRTNRDGEAVLQLPRQLTAGAHTISAIYKGDYTKLESHDAMSFDLLPRPFEIRTVPPLQNVQIRVNDTVITTDQQGIARMEVQQEGQLQATVLPYQSDDPKTRVDFFRWGDEVYEPARKINVENGDVYQIGLKIKHLVSASFVERDSGAAVNHNRISDVVITNNAGEVIPFNDPNAALWVPANNIIRVDDALVSTKANYILQSAKVDGVNVVNKGQQRFDTENSNWLMKMQMHAIDVEAQDALFGFPIGKSIRIAHPTGNITFVPLDKASTVKVESLPRGNYTVTLQGASGILSPTPVALSRSQTLKISVISYLDIALVMGSIGIAALLVLLFGRRHEIAAVISRVVHARKFSRRGSSVQNSL